MRSLLTVLYVSFLFCSIQAFAYETCTPDNSYIEDLLPPPLSTSAFPLPTPSPLPKACVEAANLSLPVRGFYGFCPTEAGTPDRSFIRPCVSERYVSAIYEALASVTDCFGYDPRLAFATFNLESAVHLNAVGRATDIGIGQLTKSAIDEVNMNALARAQRMATNSSRYSCRRILNFMTSHPSSVDQRCGFSALPNNPERNVIYSILLLQQNRRIIENLWTRFNIQLPKKVDDQRLKVLLTMLGYNAGPGGVVSSLKAYVDQMGGALNNINFDFESTDPLAFTTYLLNNFPSTDAAVRRRVSKYIGYVMASARRADTLAGAMQACLHPTYFTPPTPDPTLPPPPPAAASRLEAQASRQMVASASRSAALYITQAKPCAQARHDFEFAFVPRHSNVEQLSSELQTVYKNLCR